MNEFLGLINQRKVPVVILHTPEDRAWIGGLIQGEGCILSHYVKGSASTTVDIEISMTDPNPILGSRIFVG